MVSSRAWEYRCGMRFHTIPLAALDVCRQRSKLREIEMIHAIMWPITQWPSVSYTCFCRLAYSIQFTSKCVCGTLTAMAGVHRCNGRVEHVSAEAWTNAHRLHHKLRQQQQQPRHPSRSFVLDIRAYHKPLCQVSNLLNLSGVNGWAGTDLHEANIIRNDINTVALASHKTSRMLRLFLSFNYEARALH